MGAAHHAVGLVLVLSPTINRWQVFCSQSRLHCPEPCLVSKFVAEWQPMYNIMRACQVCLQGRLTLGCWVCVQDMACGAAASSPGDWEWPELAAIEVWGWQRAVGAARIEVLMRRDGCNDFEVVRSTQLGSSQVGLGVTGCADTL